jgi:hypothetical protein
VRNGSAIEPVFAETFPDTLEPAKLYVSIPHRVAAHSCACGCGEPVFTPISPVGWSIQFNGEAISLYPSIGNWSLPCRSHYWIRNNRVEWSCRFSEGDIKAVKERDLLSRERYFGQPDSPDKTKSEEPPEEGGFAKRAKKIARTLKAKLSKPKKDDPKREAE